MRAVLRALSAVALVASASTAAAAPQVVEHFGNVVFSDDRGFAKSLAADHLSGYPVLSPDGRTVAWIHLDSLSPPPDPLAPGQSSVWIGDGQTGAVRRFAGDNSDDRKSDIVNPSALKFSLDGSRLYVTSARYVTSPGVHEIAIATGQRRFVTEGALIEVVETGPYRGDLIIGQHRHFAPPKEGTYDAAFLVKPADGETVLMVPGSDNFEDRSAVSDWLKANGWSAR